MTSSFSLVPAARPPSNALAIDNKNALKPGILSAQNLQLTGHKAEIYTCRFSNDGKLLLSGGMDKEAFLWNAFGECENVGVLKGHTNAITCTSFDHTNELAYTSSADRTIIVWDVESLKFRKKYKIHNNIVHSVSAARRLLNIFASCSDDGFVKIVDVRQRKVTHEFPNKYPMTAVCLSENGERVLAGGIDNNIRAFDLKTGKQEYVLEGHLDTVTSLSLSHDGSFLMSNSFDENVRIWDIRGYVPGNNRLLKTFSGHSQGTEKSLIKGGWSHDGLYIACGSTDKCVYIWDTATRKIVQKLGGHIGTVNEVAFNPKNNIMASCSNDRTIILTELPDIFL